MALTWPDKDTDEVLDYQLDWGSRLGTDTIVTSTWVVPTGITKNSDTHLTTTTTIWLSSGALGQTYELTNRITTTAGRTMDQSVDLTISAK